MAKSEEILEAKLKIIYTLHQKRHYNKRHTSIDLVCKRLPNIPCKYVKKALKELNKEEIVIFKPTYHGTDVSLNVKKKKEIDHCLKRITKK